jgi:hypothetical protein
MEHRRKITHFFLLANMLVRYHCVTVNYIKRGIAHNVPAVYDVWAGIKGLCAAKTARPNVPE